MSRIDEDKVKTTPEEQVTHENDEELDMYVRFSTTYKFEDDVVEGIDLSGLSNLKTKDISEIERKYYQLGISCFSPENTASYAQIVAQKVTGLPIEFFQQLPIKEIYKIRNRIVNFFYK